MTDFDMTSIQAASLWSGLLILVLLVLSVRVVMGRRKHRVLLGDGGVGDMTLAMRAFGNAAEYIPAAIGALILLAVLGMPAWYVHLMGVLMLAGRLIHPSGLKLTGGVTPARLIGMTLTWTSLLLSALALVVHAFVG